MAIKYFYQSSVIFQAGHIEALKIEIFSYSLWKKVKPFMGLRGTPHSHRL